MDKNPDAGHTQDDNSRQSPDELKPDASSQEPHLEEQTKEKGPKASDRVRRLAIGIAVSQTLKVMDHEL